MSKRRITDLLVPPPKPKIEDISRWNMFDVIWLESCTFDDKRPCIVLMVGEGEYVRKTLPMCEACFALYKKLNKQHLANGEKDEDEQTAESDIEHGAEHIQ
jgi:hypothetical protein